MPKTIKEERIRWILPIYNKEIKLKDAEKYVRTAKEVWKDGWLNTRNTEKMDKNCPI